MSGGQDQRATAPDSRRSIQERQVRITRGPTGDYRVVEVLTVTPSAGERPAGPLALIRPGPHPFDVIGLGGDVEASQVLYASPAVHLALPLPDSVFQVGLAYLIPAGTPRIELIAELPTDLLLILIDRGGLEAEVDASLEPDGVDGTPARPIARYTTRDVEAGTAIVVSLRNGRVGWQQRLAALATACLAAGVAALVAWRRDRSRRPRLTS